MHFAVGVVLVGVEHGQLIHLLASAFVGGHPIPVFGLYEQFGVGALAVAVGDLKVECDVGHGFHVALFCGPGLRGSDAHGFIQGGV